MGTGAQVAAAVVLRSFTRNYIFFWHRDCKVGSGSNDLSELKVASGSAELAHR